MAYAGSQHQVANTIQNVLVARIQDKKTDGKAVSLLARVWIELERLKREMRGIPPLAAHKLTEMLRDASKPGSRATLDEPLELEHDDAPELESKVSASDQTVTAPPDPEPPCTSR